MSGWKLAWNRAWGGPVGSGRLRCDNADFEVSEELGWTPLGVGEHLLLYLEKNGDNTDYVARSIAELAGCRGQDVGYCGRKDRHAITRQWFSVPCSPSEEIRLSTTVKRHWRLLETSRHERKLRRGQHGRNHFRIRVRLLNADADALARRWHWVVANGCPNYFGSQRFGKDGYNLDAACRLDPGSLRRPRARARSGMLLSAARAWLFNEWLEHRLEAGTWRERHEGDPGPDPSGPLPGDDACGSGPPLSEREMAFARQHPHFMALFRATRMQPDRRALVLKPLNCTLEHEGDAALLQFALPVGAFATAIVNELLSTEDDSLQR